MNLRIAAVLLLSTAPLIVAAQLRPIPIPSDAKRGVARHVQEMAMRLDGKVEVLAAGAQIRDRNNRIVLPVSLTADTRVKYRRDGEGRLYQLWILTPDEEAQDPENKPPPVPEKQ